MVKFFINATEESQADEGARMIADGSLDRFMKLAPLMVSERSHDDNGMEVGETPVTVKIENGPASKYKDVGCQRAHKRYDPTFVVLAVTLRMMAD